MPIFPKQTVTVNTTVQTPASDTDTPFDVTLATAGTAETFVTVPAGKTCHSISLVSEGPGDCAIKFGTGAAATDTLIKDGDTYAESALKIPAGTTLTFINVTAGAQPRIHGQILSG